MSGEKIYRAGNALGTWLGLSGGWSDIADMQRPENIKEFRQRLRKAR